MGSCADTRDLPVIVLAMQGTSLLRSSNASAALIWMEFATAPRAAHKRQQVARKWDQRHA